MGQNRLKELIFLAGSLLGLCGIAFLMGSHRFSQALILPPAVTKMAWVTMLTLFTSGILLFILAKLRIYEKYPVLSKRIFVLEAVLILFPVVFAACLLVGLRLRGIGTTAGSHGDWSIGIYTSPSSEPLNFSDSGIENPILTAEDVTDIKAYFVADPFLIRHEGKFFMFFEVWNARTDQGDIALAVSEDGFTWEYEQVVLDEPHTLSFPHVFFWKGDFYMVPEAHVSQSIRLYRADPFPLRWTFVQTLVEGDAFRDTVVFQYKETWWLYSLAGGGRGLKLYFADSPLGPWTEHPKSPVVHQNPDLARPGGNVIVSGDRIIRFAQDSFPYYGNQVWAVEILQLSRENYQEQCIGDIPALKGYKNWNTRGMHHISPIQLSDGRWIASVDGHGRQMSEW